MTFLSRLSERSSSFGIERGGPRVLAGVERVLGDVRRKLRVLHLFERLRKRQGLGLVVRVVRVQLQESVLQNQNQTNLVELSRSEVGETRRGARPTGQQEIETGPRRLQEFVRAVP